MTRRFLALFLSTAIALGGFTLRPAYAADGKDVAAGVLGLLALYAIAREIDDNGKKKKKKKAPVSQSHHHNGYTHSHSGYGAHKAKPPTRFGRKTTVPAQCIRANDYRNGPSRFVTQRCLSKTGYTSKLPKQCAFTYRGRQRDPRAYGVRCLQHKGYRVEARR